MKSTFLYWAFGSIFFMGINNSQRDEHTNLIISDSNSQGSLSEKWPSTISQVGQDSMAPYIITLGITQDGGYPHIGCQRACCAPAILHATNKKRPVSLALVDPIQKKWWLFEATPEITEQLNLFAEKTGYMYKYLPEGILLTHAHIGHYSGLMFLGREALGAKQIPVYALPKMKTYLEQNGPWSQLVQLKNIDIRSLNANAVTRLSENISITAFTVPHRDEFSETAGFKIQAGKRSFLFIPDIDKWSKFEQKISDLVREVDLAFLDATFLSAEELAYRNISEVPHPYVEETIRIICDVDKELGRKIVFIHFNHTNPLLWNNNEKAKVVLSGFGVAEEGSRY